MFKWLKESRPKKILKATFRQQDYEKDLDEKISKVQKEANEVREQAEVCAHIRLGEVNAKMNFCASIHPLQISHIHLRLLELIYVDLFIFSIPPNRLHQKDRGARRIQTR